MSKIINLALLTLVALSSLLAQVKNNDQPPKINLDFGVLAKAYQDSIVVRWAPQSSTGLPALLDKGVWVERLIATGQYPYQLGKWERVTPNPIKPMPLESFNNKKFKENENVMLVAQLLYGKMPKEENANDIKQAKDQASMLNSLFSLALLACDFSSDAAQSMGLRFRDNFKIKKDEKIFYRVYSAFNHPLFNVDTNFTFSTYGEWQGYSAPKFLSATSGERNVQLSWKHNKKLDRWSGFNIEKSKDGGKTFTRLNKKPFLTMASADELTINYIDSVVNYIPYTYRVQGLDPFGETSDYSNSVYSFGSDKTPPGDLFLQEKNLAAKGIELSWKFTEGKAPSDLKHFIVKKGNDVNIIFDTVSIVNKSTYTYYDKTPAKTKSKYYEIVAVDTSGNVRASNPVRYFIPDSEPPKPPVAVKGKINAKGIVQLSWDIDTLDELTGYRVYRTNDPKHEMVCLQQGYLYTNQFNDTLELKTLTSEVYYSVCAIDLSYNHSKKSEMVKLIKPDVIPPFPPNFVKYEVKEKSVYIEWTHGPSDDVVEYTLVRQEVNNPSSVIKIKLQANATSYNDGEIKNNKQYEYSLIANDKADLSSEKSFPLIVKTYLANNVDDIKLKWVDEKLKTSFQWSVPQAEPEFYIVFKNDGQGYTQYANVEGKNNKYIDEQKNIGKHSYGLQAIMKNGLKSPIYYIE